MERISFSELTTMRWPFEKDVEWAHRLELGAIGVWREKLSDFGEEKAAELLTDFNVGVSSLQWAGGFTGAEGMTFNESIDDAIEAIECASFLNAGCLIVHTGSQGRHTDRHARRLIRHALDELLPVARDCGVKLALEPKDASTGRDWTFLHSIDDVFELVEACDSSELGLVLDVYHLCNASHVIDRLPSIVERLFLVQLADRRMARNNEPNRCLLGDGEINVGLIVEALESCGYLGFYEIEMYGEDVESLAYPDILIHSRDMLCQHYSGISSRQTR